MRDGRPTWLFYFTSRQRTTDRQAIAQQSAERRHLVSGLKFRRAQSQPGYWPNGSGRPSRRSASGGTGTALRFYTDACPDCSTSWSWHMALLGDCWQSPVRQWTGASRESSKASQKPNCSSSPLRHASMPCRAVDDWGPDRLNATQRRDLMEIVEDRYEAGSIPPLVDCSNRLPGKGSQANCLSTRGTM